MSVVGSDAGMEVSSPQGSDHPSWGVTGVQVVCDTPPSPASTASRHKCLGPGDAFAAE